MTTLPRRTLLTVAVAVAAVLPLGARTAEAHGPEIQTPIAVRFFLPDALPRLGETFEVRAAVGSALDAPGTTVEFFASPGIRWESERWFLADLSAGERRAFTARAVLVGVGDHSIGVSARRDLEDGKNVWGDADTKHFHIAGGGTALGYGPVRDGGVTLEFPGTAKPSGVAIPPEMGLAVASDRARPEPPAPDETLPWSGGAPVLGGSITITVDLTGRDPDGEFLRVGQMLGEIVNAANNAHIAYFFTDAFGNGMSTFTDPGPAGFYVRWWAYMDWSTPGANNLMVVRPNDTTSWTQAHKIWTTPFTGLSGGPHYLGGFVIAASDPRRGAFSILNDVNDAWLFAYNNRGGGVSPEGVEIEWQADSESGPYYVLGVEVRLAGEDWGTPGLPRKSDVPVWAYGHAVMYHVFGDNYPTDDCPIFHNIQFASAFHCAWIHGWPLFFALAVRGEPNFDYPYGFTYEFESPTWGTAGWQDGRTVEGRVAGALWDIYDSAPDGFDDVSSSFSQIWQVLQTSRADSFDGFYAWWWRLFDDCAVLGAIYQNTIDYDNAPSPFTLPDLIVQEESSNPRMIDLWAYASDPECTDEELTFEIASQSPPGAGVSISEDRWVDVNPAPNFFGSTTVVLRVVDSTGKASADTFRVNVIDVNDPPDAPERPVGPTVWITDVDTVFHVVGTDPDGGELRYRMDFGDGTVSAFSAPQAPNGGGLDFGYPYTSEGVYSVRVQTKDPGGLLSPWSPALLVDVSQLSLRYGNVGADGGGSPVAVLRVNGSSGDPLTRVVDASAASPLLVRLNAAPAGPSNPKFAVWGWTKNPKASTDRAFAFGTMCMNPVLAGCGTRCPVYAANTIGKCAQVLCSTPEATGTGAGSTVLSIPAGALPAGTIVTIQGIVKDFSDTSTPMQYSVTNAVVVRVGE